MHRLDTSGQVEALLSAWFPFRDRRCLVTSPLETSMGAVPE
jgi:hypothetical protein